MFYDLNIRLSDNLSIDTSLEPIFDRLLKYGYKGIAVTVDIDESTFDKIKKEKENKKKIPANAQIIQKEGKFTLTDNTGDPNKILPIPPDTTNLKTKYPKISIYSRVNIVVSDSSNIRRFIQCKNFKKYDLISFQPESQNALKALTGIAEVDIISYNPENRNTLTLNRKLYNQFVNQNVYFELTYAPAIIDSTARRNLLSLSHVYRAVGRSKNIIVTSGAQAAAYIRGPYDIINFNLLFGLSEEQSKNSVSRTCEKLLLRARKRRNKCIIEMLEKQSSHETSMIVDLPKEHETDK